MIEYDDEVLKRERDDAVAGRHAMEQEADLQCQRAKQAECERDEALAACAVMREALETLRPFVRERCIDYLGPHPLPVLVERALATDAGKREVERVAKLEAVAEAARGAAKQHGIHSSHQPPDVSLHDALYALDALEKKP